MQLLLTQKFTFGLLSSHSVSFWKPRMSENSSGPKPPPKLSYRSAIHKKVLFSPDQFGPWPECKGKSGEIRSLLETLGSTLYPRKKLYLPKSYMDYNFCYKKILVRPTLLGGPLVKLGRISTIAPRRKGAIKMCY